MKVLISVYSCTPGRGSEPGVGWNFVLQAARCHEVWALTHEEGHPDIEAALARETIPSVQFVYLDFPSWALFWKKGRWGAQVHYYLWQVAAYFVGRRLHRKVCFDLVHHVTFGRYWMPSLLALLPVPFIWGPVGGGESAPPAFWWSFSLRGRVFELARDLARKIGEHDPFVRRTAQRAQLGLAKTEETAKRMRTLGCNRVTTLSEAGIGQDELQRMSLIPLRYSAPFRLVSIGRLLHWKGFELGLQAFAKFQHQFPDSEYWIIGAGPERKRLESLAHRLGIEAKMRFLGEIPRAQALEKLAECDVLIHPSLHDSGGWVCLEAMAAGRPVICLDLGGPSVQVTEATGIKVRASTPEEALTGLAKAIRRLAEDPELRVRMSVASRERLKEHFDWDSKGEFMSGIYELAVARP